MPRGRRSEASVEVVGMGGDEADTPSAAKQNGHDESMWKSDFDAINETIACSLENGEVVVIGGVGKESVDGLRHAGRGQQAV